MVWNSPEIRYKPALAGVVCVGTSMPFPIATIKVSNRSF